MKSDKIFSNFYSISFFKSLRHSAKTKVIAKIRTCCPFTIKSPIWNATLESKTSGKVRGVGETNSMLVYSRKKETPMAVIKSEIRGACRSGL